MRSASGDVSDDVGCLPELLLLPHNVQALNKITFYTSTSRKYTDYKSERIKIGVSEKTSTYIHKLKQ